VILHIKEKYIPHQSYMMAQPPIIKDVHNSKKIFRYYINMLIFEIQNVSKHALVRPTVFCLCFVGDAPASQGKVDMCLGIEI
jgi:hypothetical protein